MIDSHSHLNSDPLFSNWQTHVKQAVSSGVNQILVLGTDSASSQKALDIATASSHCSAAVGLHPEIATHIVTQNLDLQSLISQLKPLISHPQTVAIGEVGLDYYWIQNHPQFDQIKVVQHQLFQLQIRLAQELNLPLSIHVRQAQSDTLKLLSQHQPRGVLHCFDGDSTYLQHALKLGLFISFAGNLTFKNATHLQSLIKQVPLDRLLLETDSPYLNPLRGRFPNTPANITHTYHFAAKLLTIPPRQLIKQVRQNFRQLFKI